MQRLRAGASLPEINQLLRHGRALTTSIYAKVDRDTLRMVACPWPGRHSMNLLRHALADYLARRRAFRYGLARAEKLLDQFLAFVEHRGEERPKCCSRARWQIREKSLGPEHPETAAARTTTSC